MANRYIQEYFNSGEATDIKIGGTTPEKSVATKEYVDKPTFSVKSTNTVTVQDAANPTYMTGIASFGLNRGFSVNGVHNAVVNNTGRDIYMRGTMSVQFTKPIGGVATHLHIFSERSLDGGATWIKNAGSFRTKLVEKDGIDYWTIPSYVEEIWEDGAMIRFGFADNGTIDLTPTSETIAGTLINGHSFLWMMEEV